MDQGRNENLLVIHSDDMCQTGALITIFSFLLLYLQVLIRVPKNTLLVIFYLVAIKHLHSDHIVIQI